MKNTREWNAVSRRLAVHFEGVDTPAGLAGVAAIHEIERLEAELQSSRRLQEKLMELCSKVLDAKLNP